MKELIFVHDWVGHRGPIHNHRIPDFYDIAKRMNHVACDHSSWVTSEVDPLVMELRPYVKCRVVPSYDFESLQGKPFFYELQLSQKTNFTSISLSNQIGLLDSGPVSQTVLTAIRMGQGYILLTCILESFLEDEVFQKIYRYFAEHNIPLNRVIYLTNCANAKEIHEDFCKRFFIEPELICEYVGLYTLNQAGILNDGRFQDRHPSEVKKKLFLNLNRRSRQHRYMLLLRLHKLGILDKCMISFLKEFVDIDHWNSGVGDFCKTFNIDISTEQLNDLYGRLPLTLDSDNFNRFPMEDDLFSTASLYDDTYISLVSETNFESNIIHMTEKTIKPIVFKHPFIIVGPAGTLRKLRDMGFHTFSEFWDESYDEEYDPTKRMNMIIDICKSVSEWSEQQLSHFLSRSFNVTTHNFYHFKNKQVIDLEVFVEKYGVETQ